MPRSSRRSKDSSLDTDRVTAIELFRRERLEEPRELYSQFFEQYRDVVETLIEETIDLSRLDEEALRLVGDPSVADALRYLTGPPVSKDDLELLAETKLNSTRLAADPEALQRIVTYFRDNLDRGRFPWHGEADESEKKTAIISTAAMMAMRRVETVRRIQSQKNQERQVSDLLESLNFKRLKPVQVKDFKDTPAEGCFFPECRIGKRDPKKADFLVSLHDGRALTIECKVSNSYTNSVKRLHDATGRASEWQRALGADHMVPAVVLSGVFKLHNLQGVQNRITIFWAHDLDKLGDWIRSTSEQTSS